MDSPEEVERNKAANARWKQILSSLSREEQSRLDRSAVLAVAAGDRLGLADKDLSRLRFALLGDEADPSLQALAADARSYERRAFPSEGDRPSPSEILETTLVGASFERRRNLEALAAVHPLIQPLEPR